MPYKRLQELGLTLPPAPNPGGNYVPYVRSGPMVYLSGQGPLLEDGRLGKGKVGSEVSTEQAVEYAQRCALTLLSVLEGAVGSLDNVQRIVKVFGMVNAVPNFTEHPKVINGCSDLLVDVLGDRGRHARSAVGMGSLPLNISVEIELIAMISDS